MAINQEKSQVHANHAKNGAGSTGRKLTRSIEGEAGQITKQPGQKVNNQKPVAAINPLHLDAKGDQSHKIKAQMLGPDVQKHRGKEAPHLAVQNKWAKISPKIDQHLVVG